MNQINRAVRRVRAHLVLGTLTCLLLVFVVVPGVASADTYTVNVKSVGPGCTPGTCTLPGAIEAANGHSGKDVIRFEEGVFGGAAPQSTIPLSAALPTITESVEVLGGVCTTGYLVPGPCVELTLSATASTSILDVGASNVKVEGLAFEGAGYGIRVAKGAERLTAVGDWFGAGLNAGTGAANATAGILLGPGADFAAIGGTTGAERNVFQQGAVGSYVDGASSARIAGNWFGLRPDGTFPNGHSLVEGVRIADDTTAPPSAAVDNEVGGTLAASQAQSSSCDGPCNVFATESGGTGVNLGGSSGGGNAATTGPTRIAGNYIGLGPNGTATVGQQKIGIFAGPANPAGAGPGEVTIGGPDPASEGNYLDKTSSHGIEAVKATKLSIVGNELGYDFGKTPGDPANISVSSPGLAKGAYVHSNSIEPGNTVGIESLGAGSEISDNAVAGGLTGIFVGEADGGVGNLIEGNKLEGPALFGVFVENSLNRVIGNVVTGSEVGLKVEGEDFEHQVESNVLTANSITNAGHVGIEVGSNANHTRVGGDGTGEANTIVGVGHLKEEGDGAITVVSRQTGRTEIAANTGFGNALKFISLISHGGAEEPNGGIKPPTFATALQSSATGSGARPNAKIRIFSKASAEAGELSKLLTVATADAAGNWSATYATQSVGALVTATQSDAGATSELTTALAVGADPVKPEEQTGGGGSGGGGSSGGGFSTTSSTTTGSSGTSPVPIAAPATPRVKIAGGPKKSSRATTAKFRFGAGPVAGASFECSLDGAKWAKCRSPKTYRKLKPGSHTFRVRAVLSRRVGPVTKYQFIVNP